MKRNLLIPPPLFRLIFGLACFLLLQSSLTAQITGRDTTVCGPQQVNLPSLLTGTPMHTLFYGTEFGAYGTVGSTPTPTMTTTFFIIDSLNNASTNDTAMITVTVNTVPSITGRDTTVCANQPVMLSTLLTGTPVNTLEFGTAYGNYATTDMQTLMMTDTFFIRDSSQTTPMCVDTARVIINIVPQPSITGRDTTVCAGQTVKLKSLLTGTPVNTLEFDTTRQFGTFATDTDGTVMPLNTTTYFVRDSNAMVGCVDTAMITVTTDPQPSITGRDTTICANQPVMLSTLLTGTPVNTLEFGTAYGNYATTDMQTLMMTDTFFIRDSSSVTTTMCVDTAMVIINVVPQPSIIGRDTAVCAGQTVKLSNLLTGTPVNTLEFDTTRQFGAFATDADGTVMPLKTTTYFVRDSNATVGCVDTAMVIVTTNPQPNITGRDTMVCGPQTIDLSTLVTGMPINTLEYRSETGTYSTTNMVTPTMTTTYFVRDSNMTTMCVDTAQIIVMVNPQPNITGRDTVLCANATLNLDNLISGTQVGGFAYGTTFGVYGSIGNMVTGSMTTTYFIRDSIMTTTCADTAQVTVFTPNITGRDTSVCMDSTVNLMTLITGMAVDNLEFGTEFGNYGTSGFIVTPQTTTTYFVRDSSDMFMCSDTTAITVNVSPMPNITGRDTTICSGMPVDLATLVDTARNPLQFGTTFGTYMAGANMVSPTSTTTYFVLDSSLTAVGCVDTAMITVSVNPQPNITGRDTTLCSAGSVDLSRFVSGMAINTLVYGTEFGNYGTIGNMVMPTMTTQYFVRDSNSLTMCKDTAMITVTVSSGAAANAGADQTVNCNTTTLDATPTTGGATGTWSVMTGDGKHQFENVNDPKTRFTGTPGVTYVLTWTVMGGTCGVTTADNVSILFQAVVAVNGNPIPTGEYRSGQELTSTGTVGGSPSSTSVSFKAAQSIRLLSGFNVIAGATFLATIEPCPANLSLQDTEELLPFNKQLSTDENPMQPSLTVRPNPFTTESTLDLYLPERETVQIVITDQTGRLVKNLVQQQVMEAGHYNIALTNQQLSGGILFIHVNTPTTKLVKKVILLSDGQR